MPQGKFFDFSVRKLPAYDSDRTESKISGGFLMSVTLAVSNQAYQSSCDDPIKTASQPRAKGVCRKENDMTEASEFCGYPSDHLGCSLSLVQTWKKGLLDDHCIFKGLLVNNLQCKYVLGKGLYDEDNSFELPEGVSREDFADACRDVVLAGFPRRIKAVWSVFYQSYYKMVRTAIERYGLRENSNPSADDVSQDVFIELRNRLSKGGETIRSFSPYIWKTTFNMCKKAKAKARRRLHLAEEGSLGKPVHHSQSCNAVPTEVIEAWEHLDKKLQNTNQGDPINRIILAHEVLEGSSIAERETAKPLKNQWRGLAKMGNEQIQSLYEKLLSEARDKSDIGIVSFAARVINANVIEPYQTALAFAVGSGMNIEETFGLVKQLAGDELSENAISARICRMCSALRRENGGG